MSYASKRALAYDMAPAAGGCMLLVGFVLVAVVWLAVAEVVAIINFALVLVWLVCKVVRQGNAYDGATLWRHTRRLWRFMLTDLPTLGKGWKPAPRRVALQEQPLHDPQVLYRFWRADGALLYVGVTRKGQGRWDQHSKDKPWWPQVHHVTVEHHPTRPAVLAAEEYAIKHERPLHNVVHNGGRRVRA